MTTTAATLTHATIEALPNFKHKGRGEYSSACPFCHEADEDGFLYWPEIGNYWCRRCGANGFVDSAPRFTMDPDRLAEWQRTEAQRKADEAAAVAEKVKALPSRAEFYHGQVGPARNYWHGEGITDRAIDRFMLGYAPDFWAGPAFTIPYLESGHVVSIRQRLAQGNKGKYRPEFSGLRNRLFNPDALQADYTPLGELITSSREAVLCEGEKKAVVLDQAGLKAAGLPGFASWQSEWLSQFDQVDLVYIALDPGSSERDKAAEIAAEIAAAGRWAKVAELPGKPDDLLNEGMTPAALLDLLKAGQDFVKPRVKQRLELRLEILFDMEHRPALKGAQRPHYRQNAIPWDIQDEDDYQEMVVKLRKTYTNAKEWAAAVADLFPELDPAKEEQIKLGENIAARMEMCGRPYKRLSATGSWEAHVMECGYCEKCQARDRENVKRALAEAAMSNADMALTMLIEVDETLRRKLVRQLSEEGREYMCYPVKEDEEYHILIRGAVDYYTVGKEKNQVTYWGLVLDPVDLTEDRLKLWLDTPKGKRASGKLIPSRRELREQGRELEPYEAADPWQRDESGRAVVDPATRRRVPREDVVKITLPGIITDSAVPPLTVEQEVHDEDQLQKAILELQDKAMKVLARRGAVIYGVIAKEFYTPKMTLPLLLAEFNANQEAGRAKRKRKK